MILSFFCETLEQHNERLIEVLQRIASANLKLNPQKCKFLSNEITYLGHRCTTQGVEPDPKLTEAVRTFPQPKNVKEVQSFHGLANYYRKCIKNFASIASPLTSLTKKETKFKWSEHCDKAFNELKEALTKKPVLIYPDFTQEFTIITDASGIAVGAILEQNGRVVYYASKALTEIQKRWSATELELYAVVFGCQTFRHYVLGRKFKIYTDHMPLRGQIKVQNVSNRIIRLQQHLAEFDFEILYKKGKSNTNADCLSRIPQDKCVKHDEECLALTRRQAQIQKENNANNPLNTDNINNANTSTQNSLSQTINNSISMDEDDEFWEDFEVEQLTDKEEIAEVLRAHHSSCIGGHFGVTKTFDRIRRNYSWKGMKKDIENYISKCDKCQKNKSTRAIKMPLQLTKLSVQPFDKIVIDIVGPLPTTLNGNKYILSMVDDLSRFVEFAAIPDQTANTVARALFEQILCRYNIPKEIVTDNGTNFVGHVFKKLCKLFNVKKLRTTIYTSRETTFYIGKLY